MADTEDFNKARFNMPDELRPESDKPQRTFIFPQFIIGEWYVAL